MRFTSIFTFVSGFACLASSKSLSASFSTDISDWLKTQIPHTVDRFYGNIHPEGTLPGTVVAGTSRSNPPYFFHWTRDGALTMDHVSDMYMEATGSDKQKYEQIMWDFVKLSKTHQAAQRGQYAFGGPGEPKYNVDGSVYDAPWGRLQNDGPALRASCLIRFANAYLANGGDVNRVRNEIYNGVLPATTVVKVDLEFVSHHWGDLNFDLWEEKFGTHFYTRMVQRRALLEGADFAEKMGDNGAGEYYRQEASKISNAIQRHWDQGAGYIREQLDLEHNDRSQKNIASILAVIHSRNYMDNFYGPTSDRVQSTALKILQDFEEIYDINKKSHNPPLGTAVGRYREDVYDGTQGDTPSGHIGHPWFLTTMAISELYYQAITIYQKERVISVTPLNAPFFEFIGCDPAVVKSGQKFAQDSEQFQNIVSTLAEAAEKGLRRVKYHVDANGDMAEQYNRYNGVQLSAQNLTWSYCSLLTAVHWRDTVMSKA